MRYTPIKRLSISAEKHSGYTRLFFRERGLEILISEKKSVLTGDQRLQLFEAELIAYLPFLQMPKQKAIDSTPYSNRRYQGIIDFTIGKGKACITSRYKQIRIQ